MQNWVNVSITGTWTGERQIKAQSDINYPLVVEDAQIDHWLVQC